MLINARISSYCHANNTCLECGTVEDNIGIRDTKNPHLGHVTMSKSAFAQLLTSIKE